MVLVEQHIDDERENSIRVVARRKIEGERIRPFSFDEFDIVSICDGLLYLSRILALHSPLDSHFSSCVGRVSSSLSPLYLRLSHLSVIFPLSLLSPSSNLSHLSRLPEFDLHDPLQSLL